ncbi:MAG: tetratricopeptide repeat protein [Opitutae bacterium]|jgi:tetratricopeptide (TPR) repeat protein|nr:tetratricopeptide repeat protein [Opitutae bacterium]
MNLLRFTFSFTVAALVSSAFVISSQAEDGLDLKQTKAPEHSQEAHSEGDGPAHKLPEVKGPHKHVEKFGEGEKMRRFGSIEQRWKSQLEEARRLESIAKDDEAEKIYNSLAAPPYPEHLNKDAYPILIDFYAKRSRVKLIELYEKFSEKYTRDPELPEIYFRLGNLYREFGAFELAQDRFFKVLSTTIRGVRSDEDKRQFRQTSLRAQIEIADIYLQMGDHEKAAQFFDRLLRLEDLDVPDSTENRSRSEFKRAYSTYYKAKDLDDEKERNKQFARVIKWLLSSGAEGKPFYEVYPDNMHAPESHYLLATIYKRLGTLDSKDKAHEQVVMLLDKANKGVRAKKISLKDTTGLSASEGVKPWESKSNDYIWSNEDELWKDNKDEPADTDALAEISGHIDQWVRWQKKAGNQLANEHFESGETLSAIEIYQKMIILDSTPKWQAPIVYQLGLCFERLGGATYNPKAIQAYEILTNPAKNPKTWKTWTESVEKSLVKSGGSVDENLAAVLQNQEQFIYRMAQWRLKNLRWNLTAANEIKRLEN